MANYENINEFNPVLFTAIALMNNRGSTKYSDLTIKGNTKVENTDFDNWNGGVYGYTVSLELPVKLYSTLSQEEIKGFEDTFENCLNEVTKADQSTYFKVQITPKLATSDIDWNPIGGETGMIQLKKDVESLQDIMISVATGRYRIQEVDNRYKALNNSIRSRCKKVNITYDNTFESLWDWYGRWRENLPTYQSRRDFIRELLSSTLKAFENNEKVMIAEPLVNLDEWERIKRTVLKIKVESSRARNEEDFQQIGLLCREVIISLAQAVYDPFVHGEEDESGVRIGKTDAFRMIKNYFSVKLAGGSNDIYRKYAKSTNDLANMLTHKRDATPIDMQMSVSATISLINLIGILEGKL